jgi:hypothetical protein
MEHLLPNVTHTYIKTAGQPLLRSSHAKRPPQSGFVQVGKPEKWRLVPMFPVCAYQS